MSIHYYTFACVLTICRSIPFSLVNSLNSYSADLPTLPYVGAGDPSVQWSVSGIEPLYCPDERQGLTYILHTITTPSADTAKQHGGVSFMHEYVLCCYTCTSSDLTDIAKSTGYLLIHHSIIPGVLIILCNSYLLDTQPYHLIRDLIL